MKLSQYLEENGFGSYGQIQVSELAKDLKKTLLKLNIVESESVWRFKKEVKEKIWLVFVCGAIIVVFRGFYKSNNLYRWEFWNWGYCLPDNPEEKMLIDLFRQLNDNSTDTLLP